MAAFLELPVFNPKSNISLDDLPCMAMVERDGEIIALNAAAVEKSGWSGARAPVSERLAGVRNFTAQTGRSRFDGVLLRCHGLPLQVSAVADCWEWEGKPCRLLLLLERSEGLAGPLASEGSFLEDVLDATPEATVITHEGRMLHVNREFTRLFGYTLTECVGQDLDDFVIPDGRLHENEVIVHSLSVDGRAAIETVRRTRSGTVVPVAVLVSQIRLGGETYGLLVTYRDIRKQKEEEARLQFTALHDGLTGLANRALFCNRLNLTLARLRRRPDRNFAVIFVDLDGFKQVNDTLGHAAGDELLMEIGTRLERCLRPQDTVARFGGDEFALLLDESGDLENVARVAARIQDEVQHAALGGGWAATVSASMGITMGSTMYESAEQVLRDADQAMYRAKAAGKGCFTVHEHASPAREA